MSDILGKLFSITTFGESHGPAIGVTISGLPAGFALDIANLQKELDRRRPGQNKFTTARDESDQVEILSGIFEGKTTGTALTLIVRNQDARSHSYESFHEIFRPSHGDFTYQAKYGIRDWRGGGRASARETIGRVAAGAIAQQILHKVYRITILSWVAQVHKIALPEKYGYYSREQIENSMVRCPEPDFSNRMEEAIGQAKQSGDSLGGIIACRMSNIPPGLGAPIFDRLEADLAKAMLSIPAARGFEIGSGFDSAIMQGSAHNDAFIVKSKFSGEPAIGTATNHSGGIQAGISNGEDILFRVAFKPTATIFHPQQSVNLAGEPCTLSAKGRHDPCVLPRAVPIVDAMAALVTLDHLLQQEAYHRFQPRISAARENKSY